MRYVRTALTATALIGTLIGFNLREITNYLTSPFSGDKHEAIYSSTGHNFTSTTRVKLAKQPDPRTTTFLGTIHGAQSDLLAFMSDRTLDDFQKIRISAGFKVYEEFMIKSLTETNATEDWIRERQKQRQERLPNPGFRSYPVFARR